MNAQKLSSDFFLQDYT